MAARARSTSHHGRLTARRLRLSVIRRSSNPMRVVEIQERTVPISRYADSAMPSGGLNTTVVAIVTDICRNGAPIVGFGFSSIGRFGQSGLIRERFAPRLLAAGE